MNLYLVTSKLTYSRAVIAAENEDAARQTRPDGAFWRGGRWMAPKKVGRDWHASTEILPADSVDWWPEALDDIEVMKMGRADNHIAQGVWANEPSTETRIP